MMAHFVNVRGAVGRSTRRPPKGPFLRNLVAAVEAIDPLVVTGKVAGVSGLLIESRGGLSRLAVGARAEIERRGQAPCPPRLSASATPRPC